MTYSLHFTAINGVQPQVPQNIQENIVFESLQQKQLDEIPNAIMHTVDPKIKVEKERVLEI